MMAHCDQEWRGARSLEFGFKPGELFGLLLWGQEEIPGLLVALVVRHVAVKCNKGDEWIYLWKLKAIPASGHGEAGRAVAGASGTCVLELVFYFVSGKVLIVVVAEDGVGGAVEDVLRVHVFKLSLPARGLCAACEFFIPVVAEEQESFGMDAVLAGIGRHAGSYGGLGLGIHVSPIADHEDFRSARFRCGRGCE